MNRILLFWIVQGLALNAGGDAAPARARYRVTGTDMAREGGDTSMECLPLQSGAEPLITLRFNNWYKDGKTIKSQTGSVLKLNHVTQQDAGYYQCGGPGDFTDEEGLHLQVLGRDAKFKVHGLPTIREGQMTSLNCFLEGTDTGALTRPPAYVWVKDGKIIPGQTKSIITFPSATRQDAGFYQCGVPGSDVNGEGRHLHVVVPGDILPKPSVEFRDIPVCGRPYSLHCIIMLKYIPSDDTRYTWYKDYAEVRDQPGQNLTFTNVTEADTGEYTCTVREGPVETTSPPSNAVYLRPLVIPQVTIEPNSTDSVVKGFLGGNLNLTCKVTWAFPWVPSDGYSWRYFSSPKGEQRPLVERTNTLTLGPLTREDSGQYVCQARNDQGLVNLHLIGYASVTVDVVYLESIALTIDQKVGEDDPLTLTCQVDSHPTARLAWMVNGQEVRHVTYNVDHYVIRSAVCSDNNYTCRASNTDMPGLERNATVQLNVICKQASTEPHTSTTVFPTELQPEQSDLSRWVARILFLLGLVAGVSFVSFWTETDVKRSYPSHLMALKFFLLGLVVVVFIVVTVYVVLHPSRWEAMIVFLFGLNSGVYFVVLIFFLTETDVKRSYPSHLMALKFFLLGLVVVVFILVTVDVVLHPSHLTAAKFCLVGLVACFIHVTVLIVLRRKVSKSDRIVKKRYSSDDAGPDQDAIVPLHSPSPQAE